MRKMFAVLAALAAIGAAVAVAGLDMYTGKNFTTLLTPVAVNDASVTSTTAAAKAGPIAGLPGQGVILASYQCTGGGSDAVLTFKFYACGTTNSIGGELTALRVTVTNTAGYTKLPFVPVTSTGRYVRVVVTPSGAVTNASAGAIMITE